MNTIKNFFLATSENDYEPGILKGKSIGFFIVLFAVYQIAFSLMYRQQKTEASDLTVDNILSAVNKERGSRNLLTLSTHGALGAAAQSKADDMMTRHYFSHTDPEGNYIWGKIVAAGYTPYLQLGENLAIEFYNTDSLVSAWMNSPTHRANILNEGFRDQGMGVAFGNGNNEQYHSAIANTFGTLATPRPAPAAPPPVQTPPSSPPQTSTPPPSTSAPPTSPPEQASSTPPLTSSPAPTRSISINESSLRVQGFLKNMATVLDVSVEIYGPPDSVIASVEDRTSLLSRTNHTSTSTAVFSGSIHLPPDKDAKKLTLTLLAQDSVGSSDSFEYPLSGVSVAQTTEIPTAGSTAPSTKRIDPYSVNRFITLGFGAILLILLISDAWVILEKRLHLAEKKLNNVVVLVIAMVIVALMYWA